MALDTGTGLTASNTKGPNGLYSHTVNNGPSPDLSISWDHTKFTTRQHLLDALSILAQSLGQNRGLS